MLRRVLIVLQFAISIFLIVGTLTIAKQLHYMKSQELGFKKEHVAFTSMAGQIGERYDTFRQVLLQNPRIESVTRASGMPGRVVTNRGYNWPGGARRGRAGACILYHHRRLRLHRDARPGAACGARFLA